MPWALPRVGLAEAIEGIKKGGPTLEKSCVHRRVRGVTFEEIYGYGLLDDKVSCVRDGSIKGNRTDEPSPPVHSTVVLTPAVTVLLGV